ncbi:MAG: DUF2723 domain-containing protein [Kiritimatiellae bacterium]|nr:DUF2723 domain-containing protein [Kiritimatiellia bacterium]
MSGNGKTQSKCFLPFFVGWLLFFACFALLYLATAQRGVGWQDSGGFQASAFVPAKQFVAEYAVNGNLAIAHPAYVALARMAVSFFRGSPALAVNAVSSVCMAAAVANVWLLSLLTFARGRKQTAAVAATLFGMAHMPWWMATIAEVYATSAMMLSAELLIFLCALKDWNGERLAAYGLSARETRGLAYVLLAAATGLHFSVHGFAVLAWPVYAITFFRQALRREVSWKIAPMALFAWLLGLLPLGSLVFARAEVTSLSEAIANLLVGNAYSQEVLSLGQRWRGCFLANMGIFSLNFLNPAWILAGIGVCTARSRFANAVRMILVIHFAFFIRYFVADQATFAIPTLLLFSLFAAEGMARLTASAKTAAALFIATALVPPVAYAAANAAIHRIRPGVMERRVATPLRDDIRYWAIPWKHDEDSAERFAEEIVETTENDAIIVADITVASALDAYFHAHPESLGRRKIVSRLSSLVNDYDPSFSFQAVLNRYSDRSWYVVRPFPGYVPNNGLLDREYEKHGSMYRMKRK